MSGSISCRNAPGRARAPVPIASLPGRLLPWAARFGALLLAGCATYHPEALPNAPDLAGSPVLTVPAKQFEIPGLTPHPFPANGLDETAVVTLAVLNNPDLKAARLRAGVADAQLLEAGLLPDPQVSAGLSRSALHTGYSLGLAEDVQALLTRGAAKAAAKAHGRQVNLEILWQEWQVAEKARELFIQSAADRQLRGILTETRRVLADHYRRDEAALKSGNATAMAVSVELMAWTDADAQLRRLELDANQTRHALNQLLGLAPDAPLALIGRSESHPLSPEEFQAAVAAMPHRRPDLLALRAGYQSQEERLREAILAQFPSVSAGVEQARSAEEGVHTSGFTVNLTLPLLNRNRGQIAIQRATRALLRQTYQARLDQAVSEADQVWRATQIMARQVTDVDARLQALKDDGAAAEPEFQRGDLDAAAYVNLKTRLLLEQADAIRLRVALEKAQAALEILLGLPLDAQRSADTPR